MYVITDACANVRAVDGVEGGAAERRVRPTMPRITSTITENTFDSTVKKLKKFAVTVHSPLPLSIALLIERDSWATRAATTRRATRRRTMLQPVDHPGVVFMGTT
jgi:hypothetical protein